MGILKDLLFLFLLSVAFPLVAHADSVQVGDIAISPEDFSAQLSPKKRVAKCLSCHGNLAGGDIDFSFEVHFGTPALRGMREGYLRESLVAYRDSTRQHKEVSAVAAMLDDESVDFMARSFSAYDVPPMRTPNELAALAKKDSVFAKGQAISQQGIAQGGVPASMACHGPLGEGSDIGPRLAGLTDDDIEAVAHYYESVQQSAP